MLPSNLGFFLFWLLLFFYLYYHLRYDFISLWVICEKHRELEVWINIIIIWLKYCICCSISYQAQYNTLIGSTPNPLNKDVDFMCRCGRLINLEQLNVYHRMDGVMISKGKCPPWACVRSGFQFSSEFMTNISLVVCTFKLTKQYSPELRPLRALVLYFTIIRLSEPLVCWRKIENTPLLSPWYVGPPSDTQSTNFNLRLQ